MVCGKYGDAYLENMARNTKAHNCCCWVIVLFMSLIGLRSFPILYPGNGITVQAVDPFAVAKINVDGKTYTQDLYFQEITEPAVTEESSFTFVYETADGTDLFTPENLQLICQLEQLLLEEATDDVGCDTTNSSGVCVTNKGGSTGTSIASIFYAYNASDPTTHWSPAGVPFPFPHVGFEALGTIGFNASDCYLLTNDDVNEVEALLQTALTLSPATLQIYGFFMEQDSATRGFSTASRSILSMSTPVGSDDSISSVTERVSEKLFDLLGMESSFQRSIYRDEARIGNINIIWFQSDLVASELDTMIFGDFFMAFGSLAFVFIWLAVYMRSVALAIPSALGILLSLTVGIFIYKVVLRIEYFDFIHILVVFLILGIGADDVFVVFDAWGQSKIHHTKEEERLKYTVHRSASSVFNTSFTTAAAFLVTATSPLIPISTFGIYAALVVIICYIFTLSLFPSTILLWDRCFNRRGVETEVQVEDQDALEKKLEGTKINLDDLKVPKNCLFHKGLIPFMKYGNKASVFFFTILGILGVVGVALNFSPLTEQEDFLPTDHMLQIFADTVGSKWAAGSDGEYIPLDVYWGVKDIERNIPGWYTGDVTRYGDKLVLDDEFDLSDPAAQSAIAGFCETLLAEPCDAEGCQGLGFLILPSANFDCPIEDFQAWWNVTFNDTEYLKPNKNTAEKDTFFTRLQTYAIEEGQTEFIGFIDGRHAYFGANFRLTANPLFPASLKEPLEDILTSLTAEYNTNAPSTAKNCRFASEEFVQNAIEQDLFQTTVRGLVITMPIVFVVLLFATQNYLMAIFASTSIAMIVFVVLGIVFTILGWELGITESIVSIMIVGLSVDYTVHLGHMYTHAGTEEGLNTRQERFEYSVLTMGMTVLAGAATTLGAGLFLFGTQITFFFKMAILLTLTVTFSVAYSFFMMLGLASWIGPEDDYARACQKCIKNKQYPPES